MLVQQSDWPTWHVVTKPWRKMLASLSLLPKLYEVSDVYSVVGGAKHTPNTKGQWKKQVQCQKLKLLVGFNLTDFFKTNLPIGRVEHIKPNIRMYFPETTSRGNSILKHASCGKPRQYTEEIAWILSMKLRQIRMRVPGHLVGLPCKDTLEINVYTKYGFFWNRPLWGFSLASRGSTRRGLHLVSECDPVKDLLKPARHLILAWEGFFLLNLLCRPK